MTDDAIKKLHEAMEASVRASREAADRYAATLAQVRESMGMDPSGLGIEYPPPPPTIEAIEAVVRKVVREELDSRGMPAPLGNPRVD